MTSLLDRIWRWLWTQHGPPHHSVGAVLLAVLFLGVGWWLIR